MQLNYSLFYKEDQKQSYISDLVIYRKTTYLCTGMHCKNFHLPFFSNYSQMLSRTYFAENIKEYYLIISTTKNLNQVIRAAATIRKN